MNPKETQAQTAQRLYTPRGPTYEDSWHPTFVHDFLSLISLQDGQRVLDLACGTGLVSFLAASRVGPSGSVIGIDVSDGMLAVAQTRLERDGKEKWPHVQFFQHDICDLESLVALSGQEESFDVITLASALVLLPEPDKAVRQWMRYLKPGGQFVVDVPHPQNYMNGVISERICRALGIMPPYHRAWVVSEQSLPRMLRGEGLFVENVAPVKQAGCGERFYNVEEAESVFDEGIEHAFFRDLRAVREQAKVLFKEEWRKAAEDGKRIKEVDCAIVAVARKVTPSAEPREFMGGCRCGKVRYTAHARPFTTSYCHCQTCRKLSGGPYMPFVDLPVLAVTFTQTSSLRTYSATSKAERGFCGVCGSPIFMKYHEDPATIGLLVGSIDDDQWHEGLRTNEAHIFVKEKAPWFNMPEDRVPQRATMARTGEEN